MFKKPRLRFLMLSFSALAVLLMILSACGNTTPANNPTSTPGTGGNAVKGGTWVDDLYEEPDSLIPNA